MQSKTRSGPMQVVKRKNPVMLPVFTVLFSLLLLVGAGLFAAWTWWEELSYDIPAIPSTESIWRLNRAPSMAIVGPNGETLDIRGPHYGRAVRLADLPTHVTQAFLAIEDHRFFEHDGVDRKALIRAVMQNIRQGRTVQGGSTITQQLIKNLLLSSEKSFARKAKEMKLAAQLESMFSKEEILELYLNRVFLGNQTYGIDGAARRYFGVPAHELRLEQAALLAGLPKAPTRYNPLKHPKDALARRDLVLRRMAELDYISIEEYVNAVSKPLLLADTHTPDPELGYLLDNIELEARKLVGDTVPDLIVHTVVQPDRQIKLQRILTQQVAKLGKPRRAEQAAAFVMDRQGKIVATIGGKDYSQSQFNRATQAKRQPGSSFKILVYATALEVGMRPRSIRIDEPIYFRDWSPKNYSGGYNGRMTLASAFTHSINTIAVKIASEAGLGNVMAMARRFGIRSELKPVPSLPLGSVEVTLQEMVVAGSVIWNDGLLRQPILISRITDSRGKPLWQAPKEKAQRVYAPELAQELTEMMVQVIERGTAPGAKMTKHQVAGKTGTSQNWRDAWFIGFTDHYIIGVWVGNDNDRPMREVTGGDMPAKIWVALMRDLMKKEAPSSLRNLDIAEKKLLENSAPHRGFYYDLAAQLEQIE